MTLSPRTVRLDLKCGKGAISKGEKCTKGPATQAKAASSDNNTIRNVAVGLGTAAVIGGALYGRHKYKKALAAEAAPLPKNAKPEVGIARGRAAFKEARGVSTGMSIAGAGLVVAGGGLMANEAVKDPKKRSAGAIAAGYATAYLGFGALASGRAMRTALATEQTNFETKAGEYKTQWYEARRRAQERAKQNAQSGSQGTRNVGANKAVPEPYKDLGMRETASDAELKARWLQLMRENHPDAGGDPLKAQRINAAYQEILRRRGRLDSIWADGFAIDWEAIRL